MVAILVPAELDLDGLNPESERKVVRQILSGLGEEYLAVSTAGNPRKMSESDCSNFVLRRAVRLREHRQPVAVGSAALLPG